MENKEVWKSPRAIEEECRNLRIKVGTALADCVLDKLMKPTEAKKFYNKQFPETVKEES